MKTLYQAIENTVKNRSQYVNIHEYYEILDEIKESNVQQKLWEKYRREYKYASTLCFDEVLDIIIECIKRALE